MEHNQCEGCVWRLERMTRGNRVTVLCPFAICRREDLRPMWMKERDSGIGEEFGELGVMRDELGVT